MLVQLDPNATPCPDGPGTARRNRIRPAYASSPGPTRSSTSWDTTHDQITWRPSGSRPRSLYDLAAAPSRRSGSRNHPTESSSTWRTPPAPSVSGSVCTANGPFARTLKAASTSTWPSGEAQDCSQSGSAPSSRPAASSAAAGLAAGQARSRPSSSAGRFRPLTGLRRHGYQLALSLVDLGEDQQTTEQQLRRLRFHPALATECAAWAVEEQARRTVSQELTDA